MTASEYISTHYRVPARLGMRVTVDGKPGTIAGYKCQYLRVHFDGAKKAVPCHPTWRVVYMPGEPMEQRFGFAEDPPRPIIEVKPEPVRPDPKPMVMAKEAPKPARRRLIDSCPWLMAAR